MRKKFMFVVLLVVATFSVLLSSCGNDDNSPDPSSNASIIGVWRAPSKSNTSYGFLNLKTANVFSGYDFWDDNTKYSKESGYYYFDPATMLMIIHYDFIKDCDIYKVVTLTETDLVICWIDDVSDYYTSNVFDPKEDLAIIQAIDKSGFQLDTDDYEFFEKSTTQILNNAINNAVETD